MTPIYDTRYFRFVSRPYVTDLAHLISEGLFEEDIISYYERVKHWTRGEALMYFAQKEVSFPRLLATTDLGET